MIRQRGVVVAGAGQTAAAAAAALRSAGYSGSITLVGAEPDLPYERPALSKDFLLGRTTAQDLMIRSRSWYDDRAISLCLSTTVTGVDIDARLAFLGDGQELAYDALLVATGGRPRRLPGAAGDRVRYLRTRADSEALADAIGPGKRLVVLGAGFIGCEVAAAAALAGTQVTVVEMAATPLHAVLGAEIGSVLADIHRDAGVDLRTGVRVHDVVDEGRELRVVTSEGDILTDSVLVAMGMQPNVDLLEGTAVEIDDGVVVDELCRTSIEGVFAAGDVARVRGSARVEHYENANRQGAVAGSAMAGRPSPDDAPHWFWSDQYHHNLQLVGRPSSTDVAVLRGSVAERNFSVFYLREGRVRSVFALNRGRDISAGKRLLRSGAVVEPDRIGDESVDLGALARSRAGSAL